MMASGFAAMGYEIVWTQQGALWLGHERSETTSRIYLHADMTIKEIVKEAEKLQSKPLSVGACEKLLQRY